MATILEFRSVFRSHDLVPVRGVGQLAEVVFFPGVRYERVHEREAQQAPQVVCKRLRDRLELKD